MLRTHERMNHPRKNKATFLFPSSSSTVCNGQQYFVTPDDAFRFWCLVVLVKRKINFHTELSNCQVVKVAGQGRWSRQQLFPTQNREKKICFTVSHAYLVGWRI
jgi:hypothetical protein